MCGALLPLVGRAAGLRAENAPDTLDSAVRSFFSSRAVVVRTGLMCVALATFAAPVYAQTDATDLSRARDAWSNADYEQVPSLFKKAIETGGLAKADVVDAYVRTGAALAIAGKKRPAIAAFRKAALLDPDFKLPPEAGKRALALAATARKQQARAGVLFVDVEAPAQVDVGTVVGVDVSVSPEKAPLLSAIALAARDSLAGKTYEHRATASSQVHFEIPARMALPSATLVLHVRASDAHDNELATVEKRVHVAAATPVVASSPLDILAPAPPPRRDEAATSSASGGFWHSPWPYIIGGAALAAGGAALYFGTRSTDDVNISSTRVETH
jgi:hypothetical protein